MRASGEPSDYTAGVILQLQTNIAAQTGVTIDTVSVSVQAGSVLIDVQIDAPSSDAPMVQSYLTTALATPAAATALLTNGCGSVCAFISVEQVVTSNVPGWNSGAGASQPAGPPSPSGSPSPSDPSDPAPGMNQWLLMGLIVASVVSVALCVAVVILARRRASGKSALGSASSELAGAGMPHAEPTPMQEQPVVGVVVGWAKGAQEAPTPPMKQGEDNQKVQAV